MGRSVQWETLGVMLHPTESGRGQHQILTGSSLVEVQEEVLQLCPHSPAICEKRHTHLHVYGLRKSVTKERLDQKRIRLRMLLTDLDILFRQGFRFRHGWIYSEPWSSVWCCGPEAHLWPAVQTWSHPPGELHGCPWHYGPQRQWCSHSFRYDIIYFPSFVMNFFLAWIQNASCSLWTQSFHTVYSADKQPVKYNCVFGYCGVT